MKGILNYTSEDNNIGYKLDGKYGPPSPSIATVSSSVAHTPFEPCTYVGASYLVRQSNNDTSWTMHQSNNIFFFTPQLELGTYELEVDCTGYGTFNDGSGSLSLQLNIQRKDGSVYTNYWIQRTVGAGGTINEKIIINSQAGDYFRCGWGSGPGGAYVTVRKFKLKKVG